MKKTFIEMKLFQVKPDKLEQFEAKIEEMTANQFKCEGCISISLPGPHSSVRSSVPPAKAVSI